MNIYQTALDGLFLIEPDKKIDARGSFARTFCVDEFRKAGLNIEWNQENISTNKLAGTLRGMHFQRQPHPELKMVQCTQGKIFDVAVDIRPESPTRGKWLGFELSQTNMNALYIPAGFAHGFMAMTDNAIVQYHISTRYYPELSAGIRHDDTDIGIIWPGTVTMISERDKHLPYLRDLSEI
jgi:dTDP-4-dehydrorhamnose 3,5-epimerase